MTNKKRAFVIVLDSFGCGAMPDASFYGDEGSHTFRSIVEAKPTLSIPHLAALGLGEAVGDMRYWQPHYFGSIAPKKLQELSKGKDTTTGHWELMGLVLDEPFPLFPQGFPPEIIDEIEHYSGRTVVCNAPASGTEIINRYGEEHLKNGCLIVYTSGDSVLQIAAHEDIVSVQELYDICQFTRDKVLVGTHAVGRVIARPFVGNAQDGFVRTSNRHDFGIKPGAPTVLDELIDAGLEVTGIGKISDIFSGQGVSRSEKTSSNTEGMEKTLRCAKEQSSGLIFTNLVDFDMLWGHRRDALAYAEGIEQFDAWLGAFLPLLNDEDLLVITADHGCDPCFKGTDHTREYVPALWYSPNEHCDFKIPSNTFSAVGMSVKEWLLNSNE